MAGAVLDAAKRRLGRPRKKSRPITDTILAALAFFFADEVDIGWFTVYVIIMVGFAGMFRYDDMTGGVSTFSGPRPLVRGDPKN
jgi:hypothetical protein